MNPFSEKVFWFVTGSQHLYGPETLLQVEEHSKQSQQGLTVTRQFRVDLFSNLY